VEQTEEAYRKVDIAANVSEFIEDMAAAYGWADLVVCRSGALTVSEVAAAGIAAIFVPYPHAVDDHQTRNAEYLFENGAALILPESGINAEVLADTLTALMSDRAGLRDMAVRARAAAAPDSAGRVADMCMEYLPS
jgi:UDP-N-acetylglucosamine--N-acetylmuramyl-(pentapeptide) pyrophosphoryl-undecaprenol N-acetylglucosamine transferase